MSTIEQRQQADRAKRRRAEYHNPAEAFANENTGDDVDRIDVIVGRAQDAVDIARARAAWETRPRLRTGAA